MRVTLTGDWEKFARLMENSADKIKPAIEKAILQEAHFIRGKMLGSEGIKNPAMEALAPFPGRKGSRPLHNSGALRNSIGVIRIHGGAFVGVRRSAKAGGRLGSVNLAMIHEKGMTQIVTEKQSRWFMAVGIAATGRPIIKRPGSTLRVPARPFISPILERYATVENMRPRLMRTFAEEMGPPWKTW